jgi:hypothetical protein
MGGIQSVFISGPPEVFKSLDAETEKFYRLLSPATLGIANEWSWSFWAKPADLTLLALEMLLFVDSSSQVNELVVRGRGDTNNALEVLINNSTASTTAKRYFWEDFFVETEWIHAVVTWDGTSLTLYKDGSSIEPTTKSIDDAVTQADTSRRFDYAGSAFSADFSGKVGPLACWNVELDAANVAEIFAGKFDMNLAADAGDYDQSSALQHYFRQSDRDLGNTDRVGSLAPQAFLITESDITDDVPS